MVREDPTDSFGNAGFPAPTFNDNIATGQRPACFNGPTLNGGDQSAVSQQSMTQDLAKMEEGQLAADQIPYGPLNRDDEQEQQAIGPGTGAIPLPCPDTMQCNLVVTGSRYTISTTMDNMDENEHRYVGLVNQAMTCYLNSLIQTLYMTPEFRNVIYEWKFSGKLSNEGSNIPYQLQKLFLLLQTSEKASLETKDLTASFGWESNEAYDQHDVQELCRIMFDALEHRWRNSKNSSVIQDLYKGTMEDYVKCYGCGQERARKDVFLDLPLPIKPFGSNQSYKSIEEALSAFIKPEELNGNNQYACEKCGNKQDAEKGLRITGFPKLLTIQLKRFDFDYQTLHRIKLNSRITFPDYFDINNYVYKPPPPAPPKMSYAAAAKKYKPEPQAGCSKDPDDPPEDPFMSPTTSKSAIDGDTCLADNDDDKDKREWLNVPASSDVIQEMLKRGPYIYELFSIMVHQGSASAGHYFAYIKNMDQNRWFCFNDSSVQASSLNDIYRTFGGWSYGYQNNMNAYMLMYRKVDPSNNKHFIRTIDLPQHLKNLQQKLQIEEEERERKQRHEQELIKIHYICNEERCLRQWLARDPEQKNPYIQYIHKDVSLDSVFDTLINKIEEENRGNCIHSFEAEHNHFPRLIVCDSNWAMQRVAVQYSDQPSELATVDDGNGSVDGGFVVGSDDDYKKPLETLLPINPTFSTFYQHDLHLMIDTKPKEEMPFYNIELPEQKYDMRTYEAWIANLNTGEVHIAKRICLHHQHTLEDLKRLLAELLPAVADTERQCLVWLEQKIESIRVEKQLHMLAQQQEKQKGISTEGISTEVDDAEKQQKKGTEITSTKTIKQLEEAQSTNEITSDSYDAGKLPVVVSTNVAEAIADAIADREEVPQLVKTTNSNDAVVPAAINSGVINEEKTGSAKTDEEEQEDEDDNERKTFERIIALKQPLCAVVFDRIDRYHDDNDTNYEEIFRQLLYKWQENDIKLGSIPNSLIGYNNNTVAVYISVGTGQTIIQQYGGNAETSFGQMRKLIEYKKYSMRLRVTLPTKEQIELVRNYRIQQQLEEGKRIKEEDEPVNAATQTQLPEQVLPRPVAIVPPTIVQHQKPLTHFDLTDVDLTDAVAVPPSPIIQEPIPTTTGLSETFKETYDDENYQPYNYGYTLNDPTPPPPYSSNTSSNDRPKTARDHSRGLISWKKTNTLEKGFIKENGATDESDTFRERPISARGLVVVDNKRKVDCNTAMDFVAQPVIPVVNFQSSDMPQEAMKSTSNASMICNPGDDVVMGGEQEEDDDLQSGDEGEQQLLLGQTGDDDIDDPMMDSYPSTPKISPVVSEASGDESGMDRESSISCYDTSQEESRRSREIERRQKVEKQMRVDEKMMLFSHDNLRDASTAATAATLTTEMATTTTEMESREEAISAYGPESGVGEQVRLEDLDYAAASDTLVGGTESTSDTATASSSGAIANMTGETQTTDAAEVFAGKEEMDMHEKWLSECDSIRLLEYNEEAQPRPYLMLNIDKREVAITLKHWLSCFLRLDQSKFKLQKHYNDGESGFSFDPNNCDRIGDIINPNNNLSVIFSPKILPSMDKVGSDAQKNDDKEDSTSAGCHNDAQRWKRRERPLRIKIMSISESEDQN